MSSSDKTKGKRILKEIQFLILTAKKKHQSLVDITKLEIKEALKNHEK